VKAAACGGKWRESLVMADINIINVASTKIMIMSKKEISSAKAAKSY
jgi:hypothetical protein